MKTGAILSDDRAYRYALWRTWNARKGHVMFIGLNPSTADENKDDRTIKRCIKFAESWGYGGIYMLNLFAYRNKKPEEMKNAIDPFGVGNWRYLLNYARKSKLIIAAWTNDGNYKNQDELAKFMFTQNKIQLHCLVINKNGSPRHPLYVKASTTPVIYNV